jgi:hypothetical protein
LHGPLERGLRRAAQIAQGGVQRLQLMEVAVPADTGRAVVPDAFSIVHTPRIPAGRSFAMAVFGSAVADAGMSFNTQCTQLVRRFGVGCVGIVNDERKALRARRRPAPLEGRGEILAVAGVFLGMSPSAGNAGEVSESVMGACSPPRQIGSWHGLRDARRAAQREGGRDD